MKTLISFYTKDKQILSTYGHQTSIPFNKGDKFWVTVNELCPAAIARLEKVAPFYNSKIYVEMVKDLHDRADAREFKIVSVHKSITYDRNLESNADHEYYTLYVEFQCKEVNRIYWKFWKLYKFKQFVNKNVNKYTFGIIKPNLI